MNYLESVLKLLDDLDDLQALLHVQARTLIALTLLLLVACAALLAGVLIF